MAVKRSKLDKLKTKMAAKGHLMNACDLFDLLMDIKDEEFNISFKKDLEAKKIQKKADKKYRAKAKLKKELKGLSQEQKERILEKRRREKIIQKRNEKMKSDVGKDSWARFWGLEKNEHSGQWVKPKKKKIKKAEYFN